MKQTGGEKSEIFCHEREVLSVEDVAFSNSEILKPTSLCITSCRRQSRLLPKLGADEFTLVVSKEIQGIVHEAAPDHWSVLSPIPEIQIDTGKSDNHVDPHTATLRKHTIQFGRSTHREREMNELRHLEEGNYKDLRFGFDGTRSLIPLAYMFSDGYRMYPNNMAETLIHFGILGCTDIACKVLRVITLAPNARFTVANRFPPSSKIYGNYEAVLDDPD
ncbi:hypothetical protein AAG906_018908 [Vitis piasezkii]